MRALRFLMVVPLLLIGCAVLFGKANTVETDASGQPILSEGDFPSASPCSDRDIVPGDVVFLDTIDDATQVILSHKEYTTDAALPALCGLVAAENSLESGAIGWDPAVGTDVTACNAFDEDLSTFLASTDYYPGMCRSNFGLDSTADDDDGFPRAGVYRMDACIESGERSYTVRLRAYVSGKDANKTWTKAGVTDAESLEIFNGAGAALTTIDAVRSFFIEQGGGTTFTVRSGSGKTTHLTVTIQVICVKASEPCPAPTEACTSTTSSGDP